MYARPNRSASHASSSGTVMRYIAISAAGRTIKAGPFSAIRATPTPVSRLASGTGWRMSAYRPVVTSRVGGRAGNTRGSSRWPAAQRRSPSPVSMQTAPATSSTPSNGVPATASGGGADRAARSADAGPVHAQDHSRESDQQDEEHRETVEGVLHPPPDDALEEIARHQIERGGRRCVAARKPESHAARSGPPDADLAEAFEHGDGEHHDDPDPPATQELSRQQHDEEDREGQQHAHAAEPRDSTKHQRVRHRRRQRLVEPTLERGHAGERHGGRGGDEDRRRGEKDPGPASSGVGHARW